MPRRRTTQLFESSDVINPITILRESINIILLHPSHFHTISILFFSSFSISLFISHILIHHFPHISSTTIQIKGIPFPHSVTKTIIHISTCLPSSLTLSLIGRAATIQAVSDIYSGLNLDRRQVLRRNMFFWVKLLHTSLWEYVIISCLLGSFVASLATIPMIMSSWGLCTKWVGVLGFLGVVGVPFCILFAHLMVVGNLGKVISVLENGCYGMDSLFKARRILHGKRQTALVLALLSNVNLKMVEFVFEFRLCRGLGLWECVMLVSMYSFLLVLDTLINVVFYYACKT